MELIVVKSGKMKKLIIIVLLAMSLHTQAQNVLLRNEALTKSFWTYDKVDHTVGTFGVSAFAYLILSTHPNFKYLTKWEKRLYSLTCAIVVGFIKEGYDAQSPENVASWSDIHANLIGAFNFQGVITIPIIKHRRRIKF